MRRLLVTACCLLSVSAPVSAQRLDTWNTQAREKSQRLNSAALTALSKSQNDQAISLLMSATATDPNDAIVLNTLGVALARQGRYPEAIDALQKSYKLDKKNSETLLTTGFVYYLQHDWDAAIGAWNKLANQDKKLPQVYSLIGYANLRKGDFAAADESFHQTIAGKPNSHLAYHGIALEKFLAGDMTQSQKAAEHAESIESYHPVVLVRAANAFLTGSHPQAKQHVKTWTQSQGKKAKPHSMTHLGYPIQHDFQWDPLLADATAGADVVQAASAPLQPLNKKPPARYAKATKLIPIAQAKVDAAPGDYFCRHELGLIHLAAGEYTAAADDFGAALKLCPAAEIDWLYLGRARALGGKPGEASYAINEFKRQNPGEKISADLEALTSVAETSSPLPSVGVPPPKKDPSATGF